MNVAATVLLAANGCGGGGENPIDGSQQERWRHGFEEKGRRSSGQRLRDKRGPVIRADDEDRDVVPGVPQLPQDFQAVNPRKMHVEDDEVRRETLEEAQTQAAVVRDF